MGFTQYERENFAVAVDWFDRSTKAEDPSARWMNAAHYNLARSYERLGEWENARKIYLQDESPQQHGNLLRARRIAQRAEAETD